MRLQPLGHGLRRRVLMPHADGKRLHAAFDEIRLVRVDDIAKHAARVLQGFDARFRASDDTRQHIVVPGEVFGGAVHDEVDAVFQRFQVHGRGESRIQQGHGAMALADSGEALQIGDAQVGIGRRLGEDEARLARHDRRFQRVVIAHRHDAGFDAEFLQGRQAELARPPITVVGHDNMRAGAQHGQEERSDGGHAGWIDGGVFRAFQLGDARFQRPHGRVAITGVFLAIQLAAVDFLVQECDQAGGVP